MSQYERIRPIVFQKAAEIKQVRSNSLAIRSSPSKQTLNQSFEKQLILNNNHNNNNNNNDALQELQHLRKLFISESCHNSQNNKENSGAKKFSFKVDEVQYLKNRITQLESQNANYVIENKKLAHVLDQQIQLNQNMQDQQQQKQQMLRRQEEVVNNKQNDADIKAISDQLVLYKKIVGDLESKIQMVIEENCKLNEMNERTAYQDCSMKNELEKYKNKCHILEEKNKAFHEDSRQQEWQKKCKKLQDENMQLKAMYESAQHECQQLAKSQGHNYKDVLNDLECENQYLGQVLQIDQQKMQNLEEKLQLLTKENGRLQEIVKNRHK